MTETIDRVQFADRLYRRGILLADIPPGRSRSLAEQINKSAGRGDTALWNRAEYSALFDLIVREYDVAQTATTVNLTNERGQRTEAGQAVQDYLNASTDKDDFFDKPMHFVDVSGWPEDLMQPESQERAAWPAHLMIWEIEPADSRHIPPPGPRGVHFSTSDFSLVNSGNRTLRASKRSWKVNFQPGPGNGESLAGMKRLNLKAMFNDPSQMREALAWGLFRRSGVPASRHTFARMAINGRYLGLFSVLEEIDRPFVKERFGMNHRGNLYRASCGDLGGATLEHRVGRDGDDGGSQYRSASRNDPTYLLRTNEGEAAANTYDDLALLIRTINGIGLAAAPDRFATDSYRESVERIMNVRAFLRYSAINLLIGSWDTYFATPSNYSLYNSGRRGAEKDFMTEPYFSFIPWDYDNTFGIDYFGTQWQYTDIVDWASNTRNYCRKVGAPSPTSHIPLIQNLLRNPELQRYYLDFAEHLLDTSLSPYAISEQLTAAGGLWNRVSAGAYLESDTPYAPPFTGRQFTNDEVYRHGKKQEELHHGEASMLGIVHYVRMRYDSARAQLAELRKAHPRGSSGATFDGVMEPLPKA